KDVGEAFEESQLVTITDTGKIIIQKAKVVNEFCKARKMPVLFPESDLTNWALTLAGSFCIDAEKLDEVLDTLRSMFIRKPVINIIGQHKCFDDIESYSGTAEKKRKKITNIQRLVYSKIIELEDSLIKHFEGTTISIFDEDTVSCNVLKALLTIQGDKLYHEAKENNINDGIRNQLKWVYDVKDQSRLGESGSGKDAGEVDIMLFDNANPMVIMEGLILDYFKQEYLDDHIRKALDNYNPNGCPFVYILIYAKMKEFGVFWDKVMEHLSDYAFPYDTVEGIHDICTAYTDSRHAKAVLKRNGKCVNLHLFAIAMK
ncbi:MAG: hypothetical protein IKF90_02265, partial [Parasporobacterium sp.]|nr:hypothetical protein [Parasporobacterium sp.]